MHMKTVLIRNLSKLLVNIIIIIIVLTGKTPHQEASAKWMTFNIVKWVRVRRLQWLGHILRMGKELKPKQAVFEMFKYRKEGDMRYADGCPGI